MRGQENYPDWADGLLDVDWEEPTDIIWWFADRHSMTAATEELDSIRAASGRNTNLSLIGPQQVDANIAEAWDAALESLTPTDRIWRAAHDVQEWPNTVIVHFLHHDDLERARPWIDALSDALDLPVGVGDAEAAA